MSRGSASALDTQTEILTQLGREVFSADEWARLHEISLTEPLDREALVEFDDSLPGPSISRIAIRRDGGPGTLGIPGHGVGRYSVADRDVFRPLQYCAVDFHDVHKDLEWRTRDVVEMSSAHIEALVRRIGQISFLPLGTLLARPRVRRKLDSATWERLQRFTGIFNRAKHDFAQAKDTHMFSTQDAVLAYAVARRLAQPLYPLAHLTSDLRFEGDPHGVFV